MAVSDAIKIAESDDHGITIHEARHHGPDSSKNQPDKPPRADFRAVQRSFKFWAIIVGLGIMLLLAALENTVITTAAPYILTEIPLGDNWVWCTNAFFLASAAFQPILGQLSNLFGRRWMILSVIAIYTLGSGICGGATNGVMLIAGRTVQGAGSGGIIQGYDTIVSDLVPLRYRGNYIAMILLIYSIGTTIGALIGGLIVDHTTWRWCFYINLPIGAVSLVVMFFCLHVDHRRDTSVIQRLKRIDLVGNGILIGGTTSMLIALSYAGTRYPWSSWQTLVPLLIGFASFFVFAAFEASRFAPAEPVMPPRLFRSRTSFIIVINTFLYSTATYWIIFFLPVYFQAVRLDSPTRAGINVIPVTLISVPTASLAAWVMTRCGKFKAIHLVGFALFNIGLGLFTRLDEKTPTGEWVGYMFVGPVGGGLLLSTQLPAFQAPVPEADQALATGSWNFARTLGGIWGVAIPAAIFANRVDELVAEGNIANPAAAAMLVNGGAYEHASAAFVHAFPSASDQAAIVAAYRLAIQRIFFVCLAFSGLAFLLCLFEQDVPLRTELVTDFGLKVGNEEISSTPGS
ncbi:MFS general substrate transporter [Hypoxylon sp. FL1150]|nr:MFS general substrate transporter [Hypoxylon sp. FL1150]